MLYLALEKRYNFTIDDLDVVANGYSHFLSYIKDEEGTQAFPTSHIYHHSVINSHYVSSLQYMMQKTTLLKLNVYLALSAGKSILKRFLSTCKSTNEETMLRFGRLDT